VSFDDIDVSMLDGLVVLGERPSKYLALNDSVLKLVEQFSDSNEPIASICHGQLILIAVGVLTETTCTPYPAIMHVVAAAGRQWKDPDQCCISCLGESIGEGMECNLSATSAENIRISRKMSQDLKKIQKHPFFSNF
jgi:hypothetical protein